MENAVAERVAFHRTLQSALLYTPTRRVEKRKETDMQADIHEA